MILDASFGGSVLFKTAHEVITIIKSTVSIELCSQHGITQAQQRDMLELKFEEMILARNKFLTQQLEILN